MPSFRRKPESIFVPSLDPSVSRSDNSTRRMLGRYFATTTWCAEWRLGNWRSACYTTCAKRRMTREGV